MSARDKAAALMTEHTYMAGSQGRICACGAQGRPDPGTLTTLQRVHSDHLADVLAEAGLLGGAARAVEDLAERAAKHQFCGCPTPWWLKNWLAEHRDNPAARSASVVTEGIVLNNPALSTQWMQDHRRGDR